MTAPEGPIPDQRIVKPANAPDTDVPGPLRLPAAGNAAIARLLQSAPSPAALGDLMQLAGNSLLARIALPSAPAGGAPPAPAGPAGGATGGEIADLQMKLSRLQASAAPLTEDGKFGPLTEAAVRTFQGSNGLEVTGQPDAATKTAVDTAFAALSPPVRVQVALGSTGLDVGFAQQKLNAAGATPRLAINGVFDNTMLGAVIAYEIVAVHRFPQGIVDATVWAALDAGTKGGFVANEGASNTPIEQLTPSGTANALGVQVAGTSLHPVTGVGGLSSGPAVHELQQKLNTAGATPPLKDDGLFGPKTRAALQAFQNGKVPVTGTADAATWAALDAAAPASMTGSVSRTWDEVVGGATYGLTSNYSWEIQKTRMVVTAKVKFVGLAPPAAWFGHVPAKWNQFQGVDPATGRTMPIDFQMTRGGGGDSNTVEVKRGNDRANAGEWYLGDTDAANTIPHEYGHLIGLQDEYQLHPADYVRVTGHEPPVGDAGGPATPPATIATGIQSAMVARSGVAAKAATVGAGLKPGAYAQRVAAEYALLAPVNLPAVAEVPGPPKITGLPAFTTTGEVLFDLDNALRDDLPRYDTIQVLSYSSGSIMGDESRVNDPHDHGAQPRHLAQFMTILGQALGGTWEARRR